MTKYVILTQSQCYGTGETIQIAASNAREAGAHRSDPVLVYLYIGEVADLKEVVVTGWGDISHPQSVISTRLFSPRNCTVKLRNFLTKN